MVKIMNQNIENLSGAMKKQEVKSLLFPDDSATDNRSRTQVLEDIRAMFPHAYSREIPFDKMLQTVGPFSPKYTQEKVRQDSGNQLE